MLQKMNRRQFVKGAAAAISAASAPNIIPSTAFGANERIAIGCIGVGTRGRKNMNVFLGLDECRVVAVCDAYKDRCDEAKNAADAKYGDSGCAAFGDYRELIARRDIDAVMIAVQDHSHALVATAAAAAGKDMYCEKLMGVSVAEGRAIRDAIRKHKRIFQAGTFTFGGGLKMLFGDVSDESQLKTGTKFIGDKGWVHVHRGGISAEPKSLLEAAPKPGESRIYQPSEPGEDVITIKKRDGNAIAFRTFNHGGDFLSCIRSRKDPVSDVDATHVASCLGLLAEIAARLGTKLKWDPRREQFIGNDEANARLSRPMHNGWRL